MITFTYIDSPSNITCWPELVFLTYLKGLMITLTYTHSPSNITSWPVLALSLSHRLSLSQTSLVSLQLQLLKKVQLYDSFYDCHWGPVIKETFDKRNASSFDKSLTGDPISQDSIRSSILIHLSGSESHLCLLAPKFCILLVCCLLRYLNRNFRWRELFMKLC